MLLIDQQSLTPLTVSHNPWYRKVHTLTSLPCLCLSLGSTLDASISRKHTGNSRQRSLPERWEMICRSRTWKEVIYTDEVKLLA